MNEGLSGTFQPRAIHFITDNRSRYTTTKTLKLPGRDVEYTHAFGRGIDEGDEYASRMNGGAQTALIMEDPRLIAQFLRANPFYQSDTLREIDLRPAPLTLVGSEEPVVETSPIQPDVPHRAPHAA